jgi:hypothetical protein
MGTINHLVNRYKYKRGFRYSRCSDEQKITYYRDLKDDIGSKQERCRAEIEMLLTLNKSQLLIVIKKTQRKKTSTFSNHPSTGSEMEFK